MKAARNEVEPQRKVNLCGATQMQPHGTRGCQMRNAGHETRLIEE
jgi:hypothetical protein